MEKKLLFVLVAVGLCSTAALALDPMGPPAAGLKPGQWSAGIDYSHSDMDLKIDGKWSWHEDYYDSGGYYEDWDSGKFKDKIKGVKVNKIYANIGYGICDNWDVFVRLGGADGDFGGSIEDVGGNFDSDYVFAYGFGTRVTFWQDTDLRVGGLFQMSWANGLNASEHGRYEYGSYVETWCASGEVDITEIQIAVGPTWTPWQGVSIYGGPFAHLVDGEFDARGTDTEGEIGNWVDDDIFESSGDISEDNWFGGYIGAQVQLDTNYSVSLEWISTGDADAFGAQGLIRF